MWIWQYIKSMGDNFGQVSDKLYRGSKPSEKDYRKLEMQGITTVINLIEGNQSKEEMSAEKAGLEWIQIPMSDKEEPLRYKISSLLHILRADDSDQVFFMHCKGGRHRTGLMCAVVRVVLDGWSKEDAWDEAKKYGWYSANGHEPLKNWFWNEFEPEDFKG